MLWCSPCLHSIVWIFSSNYRQCFQNATIGYKKNVLTSWFGVHALGCYIFSKLHSWRCELKAHVFSKQKTIGINTKRSHWNKKFHKCSKWTICAIFRNISEKDQYYFVHSYALESKNSNEILANTTYNQKIPAIIGKENYIGVQFHPEKSGNSGQKFIYNWLKWSP